MNIITSSSAYCFYPFSTICQQSTLVCGPITSPATAAVNKYETRGWSPVYAYNADEICSAETPSECKMNRRRVGDASCWVQYHNGNSDIFAPNGEDIQWHIKYVKETMAMAPDEEENMFPGFYYALTVIDN